jgi:hypothetical protein
MIRVRLIPLDYPAIPSVPFTCDRVKVEGSFVIMVNARVDNDPEAKTLTRVYVSNAAIQYVEVEEIPE